MTATEDTTSAIISCIGKPKWKRKTHGKHDKERGKELKASSLSYFSFSRRPAHLANLHIAHVRSRDQHPR